jgi:hypothetical protein
MWDLWWTKWHWAWFSPTTSVSLANHNSTKFSILIITRGRYNRPIGGRCVKWTQWDSIPTIKKKIKKLGLSLICQYLISLEFVLFPVT